MDKSARLLTIDVLRGVAILAVLAIHIPHDAPGGWREHPFFFFSWLAEFGYLGVPLFIVISGFCIHRRAAQVMLQTGSYQFSWTQFWKRRFIRLYPPYLAAIAVSLFAAFYLHNRVADPAGLLGWDLLTHLLLIHNLTWEYATSLGNGAFWSLGTEEQLYALYFLMLVMLTKRSPRFALTVAAVVTVTWRLLVPHLGESGIDLGPFSIGKWYQWPLYYWLHWVLGAIAVNAWFGNTQLPRWCYSLRLAVVLMAIGMLFNEATFSLLAKTSALAHILPAGHLTAQTLHGLGELVLLLGFFCTLNGLLEREKTRKVSSKVELPLAWIGKISYSIYLIHIPVIYTLGEFLTLTASPADWLPRMFVYATATIVAGYFFHQAVERWFLDGRWPWVRDKALVTASAT